jgi:hypothetical protein
MAKSDGNSRWMFQLGQLALIILKLPLQILGALFGGFKRGYRRGRDGY